MTQEETYAYFYLLRMRLENFIQMKTREDLKLLKLSNDQTDKLVPHLPFWFTDVSETENDEKNYP